MPVPSLDQEELALEILPPSKRANIVTGQPYPYWIGLFKGISSLAVWLYGIFFRYMNGGLFADWDVLVTYNKGDRIKDVFGVYESTVDGNLANATSDTNFWYKILNSHIGAYERVNYNYQRIILEYGLNRNFGTTFRQPTSYSGTGQLPLSDIYIEQAALDAYSIISYTTLVPPDTIYSAPTGYYSFTTLFVGSASSYLFNVYIPAAVYAAIDPVPTIAEKIVRAFVDKYRFVGVNYNVLTY